MKLVPHYQICTKVSLTSTPKRLGVCSMEYKLASLCVWLYYLCVLLLRYIFRQERISLQMCANFKAALTLIFTSMHRAALVSCDPV